MPFPFTPDQKQSAFWLGLGVAFVLLLYALGPVLTPFIAAAILAYALNGGVDYLAGRRIGRMPIPRALAVFGELDADAGGYRDVSARLARLSRAQVRG